MESGKFSKWMGQVGLTVSAIVLTLALVVGQSFADLRGSKAVSGKGVGFFDAFQQASRVRTPVMHDRENWWAFARGPKYAEVTGTDVLRRDVLQFSVGSFSFRSTPQGLDFPPELRRPQSFRNGHLQGTEYMLVGLRDAAFEGATLDEVRNELSSGTSRVIAFVPNGAYLMKVTAADYNRIRNHPMVDWMGTLEPGYKISPVLGKRPHPDLDYVRSGRFDLTIQVFEGEDMGAVLQAIRSMGGTIIYPGSATDRFIAANLPAAKVADLAQLDAVAAIGERMPRKLMVGESVEVHQVGSVIAAVGTGGTPFWSAGVNGSGLVFGVHDDGMDMDSGAFAHDGSTTISAALVSGNTHRKVRRYTNALVPAGGGDGCDGSADCGGAVTAGSANAVVGFNHGQVTSSLAGGYMSPLGGSAPAAQWDGMARGAKLYFSDGNDNTPTADGLITLPSSQSAFFTAIQAAGGVVTNHSYGGDCGTGTGCTEYDGYLSSDMSSTDAYAWGSAAGFQILSFWAAGNSGNTDGISDASCMNCVTVGGSNQYPSQNSMYTSSSWGLDSYMGTPRRTKPDVLGVSDDTVGAPGDGTTGIYTPASGDNDWNTPIEYTTQNGGGGTSYGTPLVAGTAVLAFDYFRKGAYPSGTVGSNPARYVTGMLVKAILIASADYMDNRSGLPSTNRFTRADGYGRVNLAAALPISTYSDTTTPTGVFFFEKGWNSSTGAASGGGITNGATDTHTFDVTDTSRPMKVALAWYQPGGALGPAITHNLNLEVQAPGGGTTYRGNVFSGEWSQSGGTADALNTNEAVFLSPAQVAAGGVGTWTVRVIGATVGTANPVTVTGIPYGLFAAGGITAGSSIGLTKSQVTCSDSIGATVTETTSGTTAANVTARTTFVVKNGGGTTVDTETGVAFTQRGVLLVFDSATLPIAESGSPTSGNGTLEVQHGYTIQATYVDPDSGDPVATSAVNCAISIADGGGFLDGGCDTDQYIDAGETVARTIGIVNNSYTDLTDLRITVTTSNTNLTILNPTFNVGALPAQEATGVVVSIQASGTTPDLTSADLVVAGTSPGDGLTTSGGFTQTQLLEQDDRYTYHDYLSDMNAADGYTATPLGLFGDDAGTTFRLFTTCSNAGYSEAQNQGVTGPGSTSHLNGATFTTNTGVWHTSTKTGGCTTAPATPAKGGADFWPTIQGVMNTQTAVTLSDIETPALTLNPWRTELLGYSWYHRLNGTFDSTQKGWWTWLFTNDTIADGTDPGYWAWIGGFYSSDDGTVTFGTGAGAANTVKDNYIDFDLSGLEDSWGNDSISWGTALVFRVGFGFAAYGWGIDDTTLYWRRAFRGSDVIDTSGDACTGPGTVSWDAYNYYSCSDEVARISVVDANAGAGPLTVTATSAGEPGGETVTLLRVGTSALYQGTILLTAVPGQAGKLTVNPAESFTLVASYTDSSPSATVTATANTDCPTGNLYYSKHNIDAAGADHDGDQFADTSEYININVRLENTSTTDFNNVYVIASTSDSDVDCITDAMAAFGTISAGTRKYNNASDFITVRMKNSLACSNPASPSSMNIALTIFADEIGAGPSGQQFSIIKDVNQTGTTTVTVNNGFESGSLPSNWSFSDLSSTYHANSSGCEQAPHTWSVSNFAVGGKTGTYVARLGAAASLVGAPGDYTNYNHSEHSAMQTEAFQTAGSSVLSWAHYMMVENDWDASLVEYSLSTDGGDTYGAWTKLTASTPYDFTAMPTNSCNPMAIEIATNGPYWGLTGGSYLIGTAAAFTTETCTGVGASNNYVRFRWRVGTDEAYSADGWFIDQVSVTNVIQPVYACDTAVRSTAACPNGTVSNLVWNDTDQDGVQDGGESGISGVAVSLYNLSDVLVSSTTTNGSGAYSFSAAPGNYYLVFTAGARTISPKDQGDDDALDSDATPSNGRTANFTLSSNETDSTWDCGMYGGGASNPPNEVPNTSFLIGSDKTSYSWSAPVGGDAATGYNVYRGGVGELPALLTSGQDGCLRWTGATLTATISDSPTAGVFWWYLVAGTNSGGEGTWGNATASARIGNSSGACP